MSTEAPSAHARREWRGGVNILLYGVQFEPELDDATAQWVARKILDDQRDPAAPARFSAAIRVALEQATLTDKLIMMTHGEEEIRIFLARVELLLNAHPQI